MSLNTVSYKVKHTHVLVIEFCIFLIRGKLSQTKRQIIWYVKFSFSTRFFIYQKRTRKKSIIKTSNNLKNVRQTKAWVVLTILSCSRLLVVRFSEQSKTNGLTTNNQFTPIILNYMSHEHSRYFQTKAIFVFASCF